MKRFLQYLETAMDYDTADLDRLFAEELGITETNQIVQLQNQKTRACYR